MKSPFKLLDAYDLQDRNNFFGRDEEIEALYNMVFKTPLLLVFGLSGTGKTSLIRCGLASRFNGPNWYPFFIHRGANINESLQKTLAAVLPPEAGPTETLTSQVTTIFSQYLRPVYLVFDQLEELFIKGSAAEQIQFASSLKALLQAQLPCKILLVIREEFIGRMYLLEKEIPSLFDFRLRVEPMGSNKIQEVVASSLKRFNIELEDTEHNLPKIYARISDEQSGSQFQLPYLQVFLDMLWQDDFARTYTEAERKVWINQLKADPPQYPPLYFETQELEAFGSIENVLARFLRRQEEELWALLHEQFPALRANPLRSILDAFVTERGTKAPLPVQFSENQLLIAPETLKNFPPLPTEALYFCLDQLLAARLLRQRDDNLELAHDSLAALINQERTDDQRRINGLKIRLNNALYEYKSSGGKTWPSQKLLVETEDLLEDVNLGDELKEFYEASKRELARVNEEKSRKKLYTGVFIGITSLVILGLGIFVYQYSQKENISRQVNAHLANAIFNEKVDATVSFQSIRQAAHLIPNDAPTLAISNQVYSNNEFYLRSFLHPEANIKGVAISPAQSPQWIYSWSNEVLYRWQWNGQLQDTLMTNYIHDCQLSPDGKYLAYGEGDGLLVLVDAQSFKKMTSVQVTDRSVSKLAFDARSQYLYYLESVEEGYRLNQVAIHQLGKPLYRAFFKEKISTLTQNPVDQAIWIGFESGRMEGRSPQLQLVWSKKAHTDQVLSIAFSPKDGTAVSADRNGQLYFWGSQVGIKANDNRINKVIFAPDGSRLFTAGRDRVVKSWSPTGEAYATYRGHERLIRNMAISRDGQYFATAAEDSLVHLWKIESKVSQRYGPHQNGAAALLLLGEKLLLSGSDQGEYDLGEYRNDPGINQDSLAAQSAQAAPRQLSFWDVQNGQKRNQIQLPGGVRTLASNRAGTQWASGGVDGSIYLGDNSKTTQALRQLKGHEDQVNNLAFSSDGQWLMSSGKNDQLCLLWNLATGSSISLPQPSPIGGIVATPSGNWIVGVEGELRVYDQRGKFLSTLAEEEVDAVRSLCISPNGRYLLVGEWGTKAKLLTLAGKKVAEVEVSSSNKVGGQQINAVTFAPDNLTFAVGAEGGLAAVFRLSNGTALPIRTLQHFPKRSILALQFSTDGTQLYTGANDGWVRRWDLLY